jgi:hypothetical protein
MKKTSVGLMNVKKNEISKLKDADNKSETRSKKNNDNLTKKAKSAVKFNIGSPTNRVIAGRSDQSTFSIIKKIKENNNQTVLSQHNQHNLHLQSDNDSNEKYFSIKNDYDFEKTSPNKQYPTKSKVRDFKLVPKSKIYNDTLMSKGYANNISENKEEIYSILYGLDSSTFQNKNMDIPEVTQKQLERGNNSISFKINNSIEEKQKIIYDKLYSVSNRQDLIDYLKTSEKMNAAKKQEFIKNKYKNLLNEYFTN